MNNQERQALIAQCNTIISNVNSMEKCAPDGVVADGFIKNRAIARVALAALTAEPVAWEVKGILCHTKEEADRYVGTPVPLYEAATAPVVLDAIDNTAQQYEALVASKGCIHEWIPSQGRTASGYLCRKCGDYSGPDAAPKPEDKC